MIIMELYITLLCVLIFSRVGLSVILRQAPPQKDIYKKLYLECCSLWIRNMDPRKK